MTEVHPATDADVPFAAGLHASEIGEGFLSSLGSRFLERLYRRVLRSPGSFLLVARDGSEVVGFVAGSDDVRVLYRAFLLHDGAVAALSAFPRLARSWRRALETLRYPSDGDHDDQAAGVELPAAELLAIAVAPHARGRGAGRQLVEALIAEFRRRAVPGVRVVVGADNAAAIGLYEQCGFRKATRIEVHRGTPSQVLTWP